ncbi:MAG TPA: hypothetical protein VHW04_12365 [Solirubrobacteraceae bacterium]|nr:hypothetical protein [Solirubrobacteraceae bacterium]
MSSGTREALGACRAEQHRGGDRRRLLQSDPGELDVSPTDGHRLAGEQLPDPAAVSPSAARRRIGSAPIWAIHSATP